MSFVLLPPNYFNFIFFGLLFWSFDLLLLKSLPSIATKTLVVTNVAPNFEEAKLNGTRKDSLLDALHVFLAPTFQQMLPQKWFITMPKKRSAIDDRAVHEWKLCEEIFHSFYLLQERNRKEHGARRRWGAQKVVVRPLLGAIHDNSLKEELETCKHFLVDSEIENDGKRNFDFAMDTLDPKKLQ